MIKILIIDDEEGVRKTIRAILKTCSDIEIIGEAEDVEEAESLVHSAKPDLLLLDIQLISGSGFDLLQRLEDHRFGVIFITAYQEHAIRAIKHGALDYVMKPLHSGELRTAIDKFRRQRGQGWDLPAALRELAVHLRVKRLSIYSVGHIRSVEFDRIVRLEADGSYTNIHLSDGEVILSTRSIREYEDILDGQGFFRVHRSHIVNIGHVNEYKKNGHDIIVLSDGSQVEVSRRNRRGFLRAFGEYNI